MAALTQNHYVLEFSNGLAARTCLYALRLVTTGDTVDLGSEFLAVKQAIMLGTTVVGSAVATFAGTVVTMPAGLAGDGAYLLVWGVSA
jgi:hypothetical protein